MPTILSLPPTTIQNIARIARLHELENEDGESVNGTMIAWNLSWTCRAMKRGVELDLLRYLDFPLNKTWRDFQDVWGRREVQWIVQGVISVEAYDVPGFDRKIQPASLLSYFPALNDFRVSSSDIGWQLPAAPAASHLLSIHTTEVDEDWACDAIQLPSIRTLEFSIPMDTFTYINFSLTDPLPDNPLLPPSLSLRNLHLTLLTNLSGSYAYSPAFILDLVVDMSPTLQHIEICVGEHTPGSWDSADLGEALGRCGRLQWLGMEMWGEVGSEVAALVGKARFVREMVHDEEGLKEECEEHATLLRMQVVHRWKDPAMPEPWDTLWEFKYQYRAAGEGE